MQHESNDFGARDGVAVVLGASGGLGAVIAELLVERGARVVATYRSASTRIEDLVSRPGGRVHAHQLDLTDTAGCAALAERLTGLGGVHTVVYAAGPHVPMRHLSTVAPSELAAQLAGDAAAFFTAIAPLLPLLRTSQGSIVAVTTAATSRFPVRDGLSSAPKAAVEALCRGLAAEEGRYGVRVNCVGPGMLSDGMAERLIATGELDDRALAAARANIPLRRFGTARDIAEAVCFLASDRAQFITGQKLDVDGGYGV